MVFVSTCVASETAESFLEISKCTWRTQQRGRAKKSGLQGTKRTDFIQCWQRLGLKNPNKLKIFIKKNVWNHLYHQCYPVFAKIWVNRGLLYEHEVKVEAFRPTLCLLCKFLVAISPCILFANCNISSVPSPSLDAFIENLSQLLHNNLIVPPWELGVPQV